MTRWNMEGILHDRTPGNYYNGYLFCALLLTRFRGDEIMRQESTQLTLISASITIVALIAIIARIMMPTMMIHSSTLPLLAIGEVPSLRRREKSHGCEGAKIEFQE